TPLRGLKSRSRNRSVNKYSQPHLLGVLRKRGFGEKAAFSKGVSPRRSFVNAWFNNFPFFPAERVPQTKAHGGIGCELDT
ncbi:MAG: hypothetical protein ACOC8E_02625, partial [Planctomycetota bacterium]